MYCNNCGKQLETNAAFCNNCGTKVEQINNEAKSSDVVKKTTKAPLFIGIAVALVAIIVIGIVGTVIKMSNNPINKILKATQNTIDQGSCEFDVRINFDGDKESMNGVIEIDRDKKSISYDIYDNEGNRAILVNNTIVEIYEEWEEIDVYNVDKKMIKSMFDIYENVDLKNPAKSDFEEIFKAIDELSEGDVDIDYNDESKDLIKLSDDIYSKYCKKFGSKKWLEDCLGYEKNGNTYSFEPDLEALLDDLTEFIEENEEDIDEIIEMGLDVADVNENVDVDDLYDLIDEILDESREDDIEVSVEITIEKGCISEINFSYEEYGDKLEVEIEISELGEAKVKVDDVDSIINKYANEGYEVYYD